VTLTGEGPVTIAKLRHRVSASIQVADIDGDGADEVLVAGRSLQAFSAGLKRKRLRFPRGRRPFASTPAAVPGFGSAAVFVGCDDGRLYANTVEAAARGGVLVETGLDIYSSPVVFEHNGERLITFGSDDERIYCVRQDGTSLEGFPVSCGAFVSATPAVGDFDGDGAPEIVVGDWYGELHALRLDGKELPKFPFRLGQPTWSSVALADINGDGGLEAVVADRYLHAVSSNAEEVAGFPQLLGSYTVGSPIVVDGRGDGKATIVVASDKLYAVNGNGRPIAGFPVDLGAYQWASPLAVSKALSSELMFVAAGWDGKVWAISAGGKREELLATGGPIFSTPAVVATDKGACSLVAGSWDGRLYSRPLDGAKIDGRSWPRFSLTSVSLAPSDAPAWGRPSRAPTSSESTRAVTTGCVGLVTCTPR